MPAVVGLVVCGLKINFDANVIIGALALLGLTAVSVKYIDDHKTDVESTLNAWYNSKISYEPDKSEFKSINDENMINLLMSACNINQQKKG